MDLRTIRKAKSMSQWSVAVCAGMSQAKLSTIEIGYVTPSQEDKQKIAAALGVPVHAIEWPSIEGRGANG